MTNSIQLTCFRRTEGRGIIVLVTELKYKQPFVQNCGLYLWGDSVRSRVHSKNISAICILVVKAAVMSYFVRMLLPMSCCRRFSYIFMRFFRPGTQKFMGVSWMAMGPDTCLSVLNMTISPRRFWPKHTSKSGNLLHSVMVNDHVTFRFSLLWCQTVGRIIAVDLEVILGMEKKYILLCIFFFLWLDYPWQPL